jgi:hypothetical protein
MEIMNKQTSSLYLRRASLCYEIAATMSEPKILSMVHLGDLYSDLAATLNAPSAEPSTVADREFYPDCPQCGLLMKPSGLLPRTKVFPASRPIQSD